MNIRHFENGFYAARFTHSDGTERWALHLRRDNDSRLITEGIIIDNMIVTLMPTVKKWLIVANWGEFPQYPTVGVVTVKLNVTGRWQIHHSSTESERQDTVNHIVESGGGLIYVSVELPVELDALISVLDIVTPAATVGMGVYPAARQGQTAKIENSHSPDAKEQDQSR